jgi:hypothetical protein
MEGPINQELARRLKELREHAKISLAELAVITTIFRARWCRLEQALSA